MIVHVKLQTTYADNSGIKPCRQQPYWCNFCGKLSDSWIKSVFIQNYTLARDLVVGNPLPTHLLMCSLIEGRRQDLPCCSTVKCGAWQTAHRMQTKPHVLQTLQTIVKKISQPASQEICWEESVQPSLAQLWDQLHRSSTRRGSCQLTSPQYQGSRWPAPATCSRRTADWGSHVSWTSVQICKDDRLWSLPYVCCSAASMMKSNPWLTRRTAWTTPSRSTPSTSTCTRSTVPATSSRL